MKKPATLVIAILLISIVSHAQTKRIAHLSHSGSAASFTIEGNSNFGLTPEMKREMNKKRLDDTAKKKVDTLIRNGADTLRKVVPVTNKKPLRKKAVITK